MLPAPRSTSPISLASTYRLVAPVALALLAAPAFLAGCGTRAPELDGCPEGGWDAAVVWSSEEENRSHVSFIADGAVVGDATIPVHGLEAVPNNGSVEDGDASWLLANGDRASDRTAVVRVDRAVCTARMIEGEEARIRSIAVVGKTIVTNDSLNLDANLSLKDLDGEVLAKRTYAGRDYTVARAEGDSIHVAGSQWSGDGDVTVLSQLDAGDLSEIRTEEFPEVGAFGDMEILDGRLVLSQNLRRSREADTEGTALTVIDLATRARREIELHSVAPNGLEPVGGALYVAHNFMNPGYRDLSEYRAVSRVDVTTGESQTFEVGPGLLDIAANGTDVLVVLNQVASDEGSVTLTSYALPDMTAGETVTVLPPEGGYYYPAGILTPAR